MKKSIILLFATLVTFSFANAEADSQTDTTFQYNDKTIELSDKSGQVDVRVYETNQSGDTVEYKSVYEGVFSDDKSYEKYTVLEDLGFQIPSIMKKEKDEDNSEYYKKVKYYGKMQAHWSGFSFGYSNVVDDNRKIATFNGAKVNTDASFEWDLNLNEFIVPLYKDVFGFSTGLGLCWRNYYLEDNVHLEEIGDEVRTIDAPEGVRYISSRLRTLHITLPVMLEWQPHFGNDHNVFLTAGVVGGLKASATFKTRYENSDGDVIKNTTGRGLRIPPLTFSYLVQAGYKNFSIYAKYSPMTLFREGEGPEMHAASLGFVLMFND